MNPEVCNNTSLCEKYLLSYYKEVINEILEDPDESKQFSVNINFVELSGNDPNLGNNFLKDPEASLNEWNNALKKLQSELILRSEQTYIYKNNVHCRIFSLPLYPELHRTKFPQNEDTNKFLQVSGTVVRMTVMKMLEYQRQYICTKCKYPMVVNADYDMKNVIMPPKKCGNPEECKGTNILNVGELNPEFCKDYQEIKMQETVNKLDVGAVPNSMWVTLEDDLVDCCKPGDNITVCGMVKRRQNQFFVGKKMEIELVIKANHVQVNNNNTSFLSITPELKDMFLGFWKTYADTPLSARDIILKSICPQLFGLYMVKLAMAVVLAGGSNLHNTSTTGVRVRPEPHLLLVGDPGTGKSQLLRFASKIIPRSVLTTGVGSTAAGLTVTAVMENGEWQLEGGALVLSDGGICCIDEFNTMKEHDRTSIHEAMEQQTISVAKASIVCKLSTRCSILAATNPKGNLDPSQPLNMNIALASPLLSRFDLILLLRDRVDADWDSQLVDYIFSSFENSNSSKLSENINWTLETLQAYYAVIKKINPVLTEDSNKILSGYYQLQRRKNYRNKSRTTVRLLDSLVRLSQGHARLMYHEEVQVMDAIMAVVLVETSMEPDFSLFNLQFNLRNDFPQNPTGSYKELTEIVLKKLELGDLLKKEIDFLNNKTVIDRPGPSNRTNYKTEIQNETTKSESHHDIHVMRKAKVTKIVVDGEKVATEEQPSTSTEENKSDSDIQNRIHTTTAFMRPQTKMNEENNGETDTSGNKRKKSNNDTPKKNKRKKDHKEINPDLAALNSMPSVHDIFHMDDGDEEGSLSLNFANLVCDGEGTEEKNGTPQLQPSTLNDVMEDNGRKKPEAHAHKNEPEFLSQKTRTKKLLSKFRFVPKDDTETHKTESKENIFQNDGNGDLGEISFRNVHSSTQGDRPCLQQTSENLVVEPLQLEKSIELEPSVKLPKNDNVKITNNADKNSPRSKFESQEEVDDLDLDI